MSSELLTDSRWQKMEIGQGTAMLADEQWQLTVPAHSAKTYHNAQIDDYAGLKRHDFPWRPPLRMTVKAYSSHGAAELKGTAGFGFWNHPFMPGGGFPRLPRAVWFFFGSPPSNMALAQGVAGHGWKCATFDAQNPLFLSLLPFAPLGVLAMHVPTLYRKFWSIGQRALNVSEKALDIDLTTTHIYQLEWRKKDVRFLVDGELVHHAPYAPRPPLGFVAWLDNQYAIVTPQGNLGFGFVERPIAQKLVLESIQIEALNE